MVEKSIASFYIFIFMLQLFGASKLRSSRSFKLELLQRLYSFSLMLIFLLVLLSNQLNVLIRIADSLIHYSQAFERSATMFFTSAVFIDATFRRKQTFKIFESFDETDRILHRKLGIKFDNRKMKIFNALLELFNAVPCLIIARQYFFLDLNFLKTFVLSVYMLAVFTLSTMKSFYIAMIVHIFLRMESLKNVLDLKSEIFILKKKKVLEDILNKVSDVIDIFNESFGFLILILIGELRFYI